MQAVAKTPTFSRSSISYDACPACGGAARPWRSKQIDGVDWQIERCGSCGYAFVNPRPGLEFILDFYAQHGSDPGDGHGAADLAGAIAEERAYPNATVDAARMLATMAELGSGPGCRFLDVGGGYGFFSKIAIDRGFAVTALELGVDDRRIFREMTGHDAAPVAFEDFAAADGAFDAILMSQILEHAIDVEAWIAKAHRLLAPGGLLAVALPNFDGLQRLLLQERDPFICPPVHLNFFAPASLGTLLRRHGFAVEREEHVSRVPATAITRRLPAWAQSLAPVAVGLGTTALRLNDATKHGFSLSVYARKNSVAV